MRDDPGGKVPIVDCNDCEYLNRTQYLSRLDCSALLPSPSHTSKRRLELATGLLDGALDNVPILRVHGPGACHVAEFRIDESAGAGRMIPRKLEVRRIRGRFFEVGDAREVIEC